MKSALKSNPHFHLSLKTDHGREGNLHLAVSLEPTIKSSGCSSVLIDCLPIHDAKILLVMLSLFWVSLGEVTIRSIGSHPKD